MNLSIKIIIALVVGAIVGVVLNVFAPDVFPFLDAFLFTPLGRIFIGLITMLVVPIVFISIVLGTSGLGDPKRLGRIGIKTIGFFLVTTTLAIMIGLGLAYLFQPGNVGTFNTEGLEYSSEEAPPVSETLLNIIPTNPIESFSEANMLQIIVFAIFIGYALTMLGDKAAGIKNLFEQGNNIMMFLVMLIMRFAPYGTFGLIASAVGQQGFDAIQAMGLYMIVVLLALIIHTLFTYGSAVAILGKRNPIQFFKGFFPAIGIAFSTASSSATLPVSMETAQKNLGVPKPVSSFVQPLGATINMDGTAILQGVATVFIAQVFNVELSVTALLTVVLTAVLASIGTAGVPGVGLIMLAMVLTAVNLPVEGIALIIGIDRLLDMVRTAVNITGDAACAVVVAESEEKATAKAKDYVTE